MLKQETKKFLEDTLGMNAEQLKSALTSDDEVEITMKSGTFLDEEGLNELKSTVKSSGYNEGVVAGQEIAIKKAREKHGLQFEGKTIDNFAEALKAKILAEAKIEPQKKVEELNTHLEKLRSTYETDTGTYKAKVEQLEGQLKRVSINKKLVSEAIPEGLTGLNPDDFIVIANARGYDFDISEDGGLVTLKNGKVVVDKLEKPLHPKSVLSDFASQNGWIGGKPGRGGSSDAGGGEKDFKTLNDVYAFMDKNKIDPLSTAGEKLVDDFKNQK